MNSDLSHKCDQFVDYIKPCNLSYSYLDYLWISINQSTQQNWYSRPMLWIGVYIASASLLCTLAMVADLLHGLRNKKLWFPCNYFTLNAASLTVISVAIKLPMDLTNLTPGYVDRAAKLGSLSFMCIMLANFLPSLATMGSKELVSNMIALGILVITLVVNVCIQISTGILSYDGEFESFYYCEQQRVVYTTFFHAKGQELIATMYVVMLLMLLIIYACSSLAILKSKQILESKYQAAHQTTLKHQELQQGRVTVEQLKQHVSNYWIMAGTGSPQFMTICFPTTSAAGVICALSTGLHIYIFQYCLLYTETMNSEMSYKWSMPVILLMQFIGVLLGTLAPLSRCFAALSFKLSVKWIWSHIKVFKVESYWTQKLSDWKQRNISIPFRSRKVKAVLENFKVAFLSICIGLQKTIVVACKMIAVTPFLFVVCVSSFFHCWKWLKAMFCFSSIELVQNPMHPGKVCVSSDEYK